MNPYLNLEMAKKGNKNEKVGRKNTLVTRVPKASYALVIEYATDNGVSFLQAQIELTGLAYSAYKKLGGKK